MGAKKHTHTVFGVDMPITPLMIVLRSQLQLSLSLSIIK